MGGAPYLWGRGWYASAWADTCDINIAVHIVLDCGEHPNYNVYTRWALFNVSLRPQQEIGVNSSGG